MAGQEQEHVKLALGELGLLAADDDAPRRRIDRHVLELDRRLVLGRGVNPPQHGVDAGDEFSR